MDILLKTTTNITINKQLYYTFAFCLHGLWNLTENNVGPGPIHHTKGGSLHPAGYFLRGRGWTPLDKASQTHFSRSSCSARKASEICLLASEKTVGESLTGRPHNRLGGIATTPPPIPPLCAYDVMVSTPLATLAVLIWDHGWTLAAMRIVSDMTGLGEK